jgi:hypothetical protein
MSDLDAPDAADAAGEPDEEEVTAAWAEGHAEDRPIDKFRKSATGSVLAAGMLGLGQIFESVEKEEPAIVVDAGGDAFDPELLIRLDPDNPADSIVMIRRPPENSD